MGLLPAHDENMTVGVIIAVRCHRTFYSHQYQVQTCRVLMTVPKAGKARGAAK